MKHTIHTATGNLIITADESEREQLRALRTENGGHFTSNDESDQLENLLGNSELQWLDPAATGDLTSAPMLGITYAGKDGDGLRERSLPPHRFGEINVGADEEGGFFAAISHRWAFMKYQIHSFLDDLADKGECVWQGGEADGWEDADTRTGLFPSALYWASFNRFEMRITGECATDCSQPGQDASDDVKAWKARVVAQIAADGFANGPTPDKIRAELAELGAWDETELADDSANMDRLIWTAANNVREDDAPDCTAPVNTIKVSTK